MLLQTSYIIMARIPQRPQQQSELSREVPSVRSADLVIAKGFVVELKTVSL